MIGHFGWRETYFIVGCIGVLFALIALILIKDPERGRFDPKKSSFVSNKIEPQKSYIKGFLALILNKCTLWCTIGGMFRFWQGYTISYYAISFFAPYLEPV
jgi:predicted MFS family arabinose efflux permease